MKIMRVKQPDGSLVDIPIGKGADGKTPYIQDGYWYIDGVNTNVKAEADAQGTAQSLVSTHNTNDTAHNDIRLELKALAERINAALDSDDTTLADAINTALAQAKASGEFDGKDGLDGKTAYKYAQDGGYTGTEAEFAIKMAQKIPSKTSDLTNDSGFIKASEAPIQSVNNKTGEVTLSATDVGARPSTWMPSASDVGAVPTTRKVNGQPLSADVNFDIPDSLAELTGDAAHRTVSDTEKSTWNNKSDFSGSYNDLTDKPTIPSIAGLASTSYVDQKVASIVDSSPEALNTLSELAASLGNDPNFATTVSENIGKKVDKTTTVNGHALSENVTISKSDVGLGNVPNVATNDQTPTFTEASSLANINTGEKLSTLFGKIKKAITDLIAHIANKNNPHSVTKSQVGLGNVENKSSETIRSEITKENLTSAFGYTPIETESDPTVPSWAKASTKPTYTAEEVGALPDTTVIPTVPTNVSAFANDAGYLTEHQSLAGLATEDYVDNQIAAIPTPDVSGQIETHNTNTSAHADIREQINQLSSEIADKMQLTPEFAQTIEECIDTTKMYVLPDGFIYAYVYSEATRPSYNNLAGDVQYDKRLSSSGTISGTPLSGAAVTGFIPVKKGQVLRVKGLNISDNFSGSTYPYFCFYTSASESDVTTTGEKYLVPSQNAGSFTGLADTPNGGVCEWTAFTKGNSVLSEHANADNITHIRISGKYFADQEIVVTVNEEITEGASGGYSWQNTGHAFVPADYEEAILNLQNSKANKTEIPTKLPNPNKLTIDGVEYDGSEAVNIETQSGGNILYGKKWVACGDSFTANGYNASDGFDESEYIYQDGRFAGRYKVYPNMIGLRNNMNIVNLATGGQTMAASSNSFMTRYTTIDADADYITIMLGINDKVQGIAVGTLEDNTNTTFCGAFNIAMEHIIENHPFAHIGIMVSHGTNAEIMEATRGIAERWGVPYLDYGSPQVPLMNRYTGRNVCAKAQEIREKNFCVISDGTTPTNAHPNTKAHEYESTFIEAWLRTL